MSLHHWTHFSNTLMGFSPSCLQAPCNIEYAENFCTSHPLVSETWAKLPSHWQKRLFKINRNRKSSSFSPEGQTLAIKLSETESKPQTTPMSQEGRKGPEGNRLVQHCLSFPKMGMCCLLLRKEGDGVLHPWLLKPGASRAGLINRGCQG